MAESAHPPEDGRLLTLDAMRGIAALCVMATHVKVAGMPHLVASGYLAVDFFFLLSGLVIARTYEARLNAGMGFAQFAFVRVVRIYPLYLVGFGLGLVKCLGQIVFDRPDRPSAMLLSISSSFELFLLPSPTRAGLFLLDVPAWSLFFEWVINVLFALVLFRSTTRALVGITLAFAALLAVVAIGEGSLNVGQSWPTFHGGIARVGFSFTLGVIIARLPLRTARSGWLAMVPMALLVLMLSVPADEWRRDLYDLLAVVVAAPLLVLFGAAYNPLPGLRGICRKLGELSYPVYAIHYPLLWIVGYLARKAGVAPAFWIPAFFILVVALAWLLNDRFDAPVRRRLNAMRGRAPLRA